MASLSNIVNARLGGGDGTSETNLEQGQIYYYRLASNSGNYTSCEKCAVWTAPASGEAVIEIWGAGGSTGKMCCCGYALPGNPGAYSKKTIAVTSGEQITMNLGAPCRNDQLCWKGISEPTCVCYVTAGAAGSGTICAGGGRGGHAFCVDGGSSYCCAVNCGYPGQLLSVIGGAWSGGSNGCGIVCNYCAEQMPTATGGDVNLAGGFSCVTISHCNPCCQCHFYATNALPPGFGTKLGGYVSYNSWCGIGADYPSGVGYKAFMMALNGYSRSPNYGNAFNTCWGGGRNCGCYDCTNQQQLMPHGVGGPIQFPCSSVRNHGQMGGSGAVRIQFK